MVIQLVLVGKGILGSSQRIVASILLKDQSVYPLDKHLGPDSTEMHHVTSRTPAKQHGAPASKETS